MPQIGLQVYVFPQDQFKAECERIVAHAAECGYAGIEGLPCFFEDYSSTCHTYKVDFFGPHVVAANLQKLEEVIAYCKCMGADHVISSGLIEWDNRSEDDYLRCADLLNKAGEELQKHGVQLHYHNHEFEFELIDNALTGMDLLMNNTDPGQVNFCLDLGWLVQAGGDPNAFLSEHADRISYVHLRDFNGDQSVALGQGELPVEEMWKTINTLPQIKHVIVEQDPKSLDPYADSKTSITYLQSL